MPGDEYLKTAGYFSEIAMNGRRPEGRPAADQLLLILGCR